MGINIGAFVCNFVAAFLRINYSWGYAFAAAGFGMVLCLFIFASGQKYVKHADVIKPVQKEDMPFSKIISLVFLPRNCRRHCRMVYSGKEFVRF